MPINLIARGAVAALMAFQNAGVAPSADLVFLIARLMKVAGSCAARPTPCSRGRCDPPYVPHPGHHCVGAGRRGRDHETNCVALVTEPARWGIGKLPEGSCGGGDLVRRQRRMTSARASRSEDNLGGGRPRKGVEIRQKSNAYQINRVHSASRVFARRRQDERRSTLPRRSIVADCACGSSAPYSRTRRR